MTLISVLLCHSVALIVEINENDNKVGKENSWTQQMKNRICALIRNHGI